MVVLLGKRILAFFLNRPVGGESRGLPFVVGRLWLIPGVAGGRAESGSVEDWPKGGGDVHKPALHHYQEVSSLHLSGPRLRD